MYVFKTEFYHILRLEKNFLLFFILVVTTGGCHPVISLVSSRIFGLKLLSSGLSKYELGKLLKIKIFTTVYLENIPQIFVQGLYSVRIENITEAVAVAFAISVLSIITTLIEYLLKKDPNNRTVHIEHVNSESNNPGANLMVAAIASNMQQKPQEDIARKIIIDKDGNVDEEIVDSKVDVELASILEKVLDEDDVTEKEEHAVNDGEKPHEMRKGEKSFYGDPHVRLDLC